MTFRDVPLQIQCESCGMTLLGFRSTEPKPIGREECPNCGDTEFSAAED